MELRSSGVEGEAKVSFRNLRLQDEAEPNDDFAIVELAIDSYPAVSTPSLKRGGATSTRHPPQRDKNTFTRITK